MKNSHYVPLVSMLLAVLVLLAACKKSADKPEITVAAEAPLVVTTIAPYQFLLQQLAGEHIQVLNTSEQSADPHIVDLTPQQIVQLQKAGLFLSLNPLEEHLLLESLGSQTKVVEMWHGFALLAPSGEGHSHAEEHEEEHSEDEHREEDEHGTEDGAAWDGHFWLGPDILPFQIETMARELESLIPEQKQLLASNKQELLQRNQELIAQLRSSLAQLQGGKIMSFHSALAYFADFFNAEQIFVQAQDIELGSNEMLHLFEEVRELTFPVLIISPQFEPEKAKTLAKQLDLGLVEFDPLQPDVFTGLANLAADLTQN